MKTQVIDIQSITPDMVVRAYVGKPGCMCGCKGKYYRNVASDKEDSSVIDAKMVTRILRVLQANEDLVESEEGAFDGEIIVFGPPTGIAKKNYVVYLRRP
jgi:uncharacterized protein (DUF169 family)